jgi:CopG family transcriptional regulator, nickel-responsive regulator
LLEIRLTLAHIGATLFQKGNTVKSNLRRFSISMSSDLVRQLDLMARAKGYANRSQAVSDMAKAQLIEHNAYFGDDEIAGAITLVYSHHRRGIQKQLTEIQHHSQEIIISSMHCHLDHDNCMEVIVARGQAAELRKLADLLIATKGVKHGKLTITTLGKEFDR